MLRAKRCWTHSLAVIALALSLAVPALASTTATITVSGSEHQIGGGWDQGAITIAFNGFSETVTYGQFSSAASVASALAGVFSRDYAAQGLSAKAACPPSGAVITFTLQGTATFGPLGVSDSSSSFQISSSGFQSTATQATPVLTWPLPAAITYGTALSSTQLNATANVPGTFSYDPAGGTILPPGDQVLGVTFTPTDTTDYSVVTETIPLTVNGSSSGGGQTIYSYGLNYQPNNNVNGYNDSVMGAWSFGYDNLNRLAQAQAYQPGNSMTHYCWSYDAFGNRWQQMGSNEAISGGGGSLCEQQSGANISYAWASYSSNNRMSATSQNVNQAGGYDAAGNVTYDGANHYLYNADGQICAVEWIYNSMTVMTGYIYDADGNRVAKGAISTMSCDPSTNGFTTQADYVRDQAGHQLSEFVPGQNGAMTWQHTNVYANGELIATEDNTEAHFYLNDWLGTRRVQTDYKGTVEQTCSSLPYGDGETCQHTPTENLFTGKERDSESGNDYFGARYYASSMGRFQSPDYDDMYDDPEPIPYAIMGNPQTLNLYSYAGNNPLSNIDPDGHDCIYATGVGSGFVVKSGDCISDTDSGIYVNGTVTSANYNASNNSIGYTYTAYDTGTLGSGVIANVPAPGPEPQMDEGAVTDETGGLLMGIAGGMATDYVVGRIVGLFGRGAEEAATAASRAAPDVTNLSPKIVKQMASRGWTKDEIMETVKSGVAHDVTNKATGGPAVEYVNPANGKFVVIDKSTNHVLQVSGPGFLPNHLNP